MKAALALIALLLAPLLAQGAVPADLRRAKDHFEYGEYDEARKIAEELLSRNVLATDEDLIDANRIVALSYLYGNRGDRREKAEKHFLQLLSIEPDYRLDPFFTPPAALEFFEQVRATNEEKLAPIREQRRLAKQARAAEEAARRRFLEDRAKEKELEGPSRVQFVERRHFALVFLPFGAGQFQNGDRGKGIALASIQATAALASVGSYLMVENLESSDGRFAPKDIRTARGFATVKWASAAVFYAAWLYGVADAWRDFREEVILTPPAEPEGVEARWREEDGKGAATLGFTLRF